MLTNPMDRNLWAKTRAGETGSTKESCNWLWIGILEQRQQKQGFKLGRIKALRGDKTNSLDLFALQERNLNDKKTENLKGNHKTWKICGCQPQWRDSSDLFETWNPGLAAADGKMVWGARGGEHAPLASRFAHKATTQRGFDYSSNYPITTEGKLEGLQ